MTLHQTHPDTWTAETFVAWSEAQPRRHELLDGVVYTMNSERTGHARLKGALYRALGAQIIDKDLPCEAFVDGMAVKVDRDTVFEPDVLVRCGENLADDEVLILDPIIVVEVASPSTQRLDALTKLTRYFRNPSIVHYLIVVAESRTIIHHERATAGLIQSSSHTTGPIRMMPPGLELDVAAIFASLRRVDPGASEPR